MKKSTLIALMCLVATGYVSSCAKNEEKPVVPPVPDIPPGPSEYVDLGLPSGTMWASYNLGADSLTQLGTTYTGEDALKIDFQIWRLPTVAELEELMDMCYWEWSKSDNGFHVTSKRYEDRSIFLPANTDSFEGMYWSSTTYCQDKQYFLANVYIRFDSVRDRTKMPEIRTKKLSDADRYPVRLVLTKADPKPYVNLGLTSGLKWGMENIGAKSGSGKFFGDYFTWGGITTYYTDWNGDDKTPPKPEQWKEKYKEKGYTWSNYRFINALRYKGKDKDLPEKGDFTKYAMDTLTLKLEDDVANVRLGKGWRIPRKEEFDELYNECYWVWTKDFNGNGVAGYIVYKSQDKATDRQEMKEETHTYSMNKDPFIFLPAAGYLDGKDFCDANCGGYYWSCELKPEEEPLYESDTTYYNPFPYEAYCLTFDNYEVFPEKEHENPFRYFGQPVRPVYDGQ